MESKEQEPVGKDESGYSEKQTDLNMEIAAGEWESLKKFKVYQNRSRQGKIIATYQAVSNRLRQLDKLFYELCRNHPSKAEKLLKEIRRLRFIQDILVQCLVWEPQGQLTKGKVPQEVWDLIK